MEKRDYTYFLTPEDKVRIAFDQSRGTIRHFIVQYSSLIKGRWRSIMRFDTCHGYAHKHTHHLASDERIVTLTAPGDRLNETFTEASAFIKDNYRNIKANYLKN